MISVVPANSETVPMTSTESPIATPLGVALAPYTKIASEAPSVSGPGVWMYIPWKPPVGYDAVTTPW